MRRFVALLAFAALAACGGDSSITPGTVTGSYSLRTVNGSPLPFTVIQIGADKIEITGDVIILNEGGTFTETTSQRTTENGVVTTSTIDDAGTYTLTGTAITLTSPESGSISGAVSGGTMTLTLEGLAAVYSK
jgi:hypothetical protein